MMQTRETLPILLKAQKILLIGAGKVALQKAEVLFKNNISFRVVASEILEKMHSYCQDIRQKDFENTDIQEYFIVINATGKQSVTEQLLAYKKTDTLLLNVVDKPEYCDFYFMALTANKPLQIAVSSHGSSPTVAQYFRDACEKLIPKDIEPFMQDLASQREKGLIDKEKTLIDLEKIQSKVYLLGCGLGDPDLLTIKAYRIMQSVDVVLYDHLISEAIMEILPEKTQKVFVGKEKGFHSKAQEEINLLIEDYVQKGYSVARLKSGDPFIYGRGAEELLYLNNKGIQTEVIAGISSAISAPLMANIPLTARGISNSFSVVSAHLRGNALCLDWIKYLEDEAHTVVVLMGLSRAKEIQDHALAFGIDKDKPCAIVSHASREAQSSIVTTLEHLATHAKTAQRPAILVFGEVVNYPKLLKEIR
ncbi:Uroporphyrinogen-III methyltransferase [hydrothermal vent metagenome]|uniref:Uroporphyrinogen-III methyltransferase n=1 Tax=hydrothermal vent metagenome TaxID=652676 RepID=A0A1W1CKQ6_9ZZZZ